MLPPDKPVIEVECDVPPVVENVFAIDEYATPGVVECLHVAASLVVNDNVVDAVPAGSVPDGAPDDLVGGVVSLDVTVSEKLVVFVTPEPVPVTVIV